MKLYRWNELAKEELKPGLARQVLHGEKMTVARIFLAEGAVVPEHHHPTEQLSIIESGKMRFLVDGREVTVAAGEMLLIPVNAPHSGVALEETVALDLHCPRREDWVSGDDAYLRR